MDISKELGLPDFQNVNLPSFEISSYGAANMVADQLGIKEPPVTLVAWSHGWDHRDTVDLCQLAYDMPMHKPGEERFVIPVQRRRPLLVTTKIQEKFLHDNGFPDSRAIGLPFAYVEPDPTTRRMPGSLLVMPPRSGNPDLILVDEIEYLDYIKSIEGHFSRVVFCLHLVCLRDNQWVHNLEKYGYDYVFGAGGRDRFALPRIRKLMDSFEYMTTNGVGSHVLYAAFCGVKVSMAGPFYDFDIREYEGQFGWGEPDIMKRGALEVEMGSRDYLSKKFPWFFTEPHLAKACVEWAKEEIGFYNKVSFEALGRLFGWLPAEPPDFAETIFRLDGNDDFAGFLEFVKSRPHDSNEILPVMTRLFTQQRLRSAFVLAMLLMNRGAQNPIVSAVLSVGGVVFDHAAEEARGLKSLQAQVDLLPAKQQEALYKHALAPVLSPLLVTALQNEEGERVQRLLEVVKAAVPRFRERVDWHLKVVDGVVYKSLFP